MFTEINGIPYRIRFQHQQNIVALTEVTPPPRYIQYPFPYNKIRKVRRHHLRYRAQ